MANMEKEKLLTILSEREEAITNLKAQLDELRSLLGKNNHITAPALNITNESNEQNILPLKSSIVSVEELLERNEKIPVKQSIEIITEILKGLENLHSHYIIHGDIKPSNIIIRDEKPYLIDFGITKQSDFLISDNKLITGTPMYMSPESFHGDFTIQTDIWATGITLYQMITGKTPSLVNLLKEPSFLELNLTSDGLNFLQWILIPDELHEVFQRTLAINPLDRYRSAREMQENLLSVLSKLPNQEINKESVEKLSDSEILALTKFKMSAEKQAILIELLETNKENALTVSEQQQLNELMEEYDEGLLRKSEALNVAVKRGLIEPRSK